MPRIVLVDSNLLTLFVLGGVSRDHIERFPRTSGYTVEDYDLLIELVDGYDEVVVTPHVLTESLNFLGHLTEPLRGTCFAAVATLVGVWREEWTAAATLVGEPIYLRLGLADSAVYRLAAGDVTVLTGDHDLYIATATANRTAINFNHERQRRGLFDG